MNLNEIDYTKTFHFTSAGDEYTYNPPVNGINKKCTVTWEDEFGAGAEVYTLNSVKSYIEEGDWHYVEGSQKPALPETFKFESKHGECVCTALRLIGGSWRVSWSTCSRVYTEEQVDEFIQSGTWAIVEDFPTCENNVTLESVIAEFVKGTVHTLESHSTLPSETAYYHGDGRIDVTKEYPDGTTHTHTYFNPAHKHEQQCPNAYANEALKAFTIATGASVSVINGTYTILYNEACYEAEDDEKLNDIIKCITFLENV